MLHLNLLPGGQFTSLENISVESLVSAAVNIFLVIAPILFFFTFLLGGLKLILSGGNKEKVNEAKNQIINAFIGIFIVFSVWALIKIVGDFFGINLTVIDIPRINL